MLNTHRKGAKGTELLNRFSNKIATFAILSNLVIRSSKSFKPEVFLLALMKAANQGNASMNKIAMEMFNLDVQCDLSPQALWKRLNRSDCYLEQFLGKCIALICSQSVIESKLSAGKFKRILTEDSSFVKMLKTCADLFPAHGNKHGKTAGLKLNLIFDLLTGETIEASTHYGTEQDRSIAYGILNLIKRGDLVLRDMGYFCVEIFGLIEVKGADWLSRLPRSIIVTVNEVQTIEDILEKSKSGFVDRNVQLTDSKKLVRLIAVRMNEKAANEAVRKLKLSAAENGRKVSKKALIRARWHILVTSVSKDTMTAKDLGNLYAQRWQIEMIFKAWKQSNKLTHALSKRSNYQHLLGIFLSEVFKLVITLRHYAFLRVSNLANSSRLSIAKLSDWLSSKIGSAKIIDDLFEVRNPSRLLLTQKRTRKFQLISMFELLG